MMMRRLSLALGLAFMLIGPGLARAQSSDPELQVPLGKSQTLQVDRPFTKAIIGDPDVADVMPMTSRSVYVMGKKIGATNLSLYDRAGGVVAVVDIDVGPDAQGLKRKLSELMPGEPVEVSISNQSLVLKGGVSNAAIADRAYTIADTFAHNKVVNLLSVREPQQVLLEVRFAEMSRSTVKQLGISSVTWQNGTAGGTASVPAINSSANPYALSFNFPHSNLQIAIDALDQKGLIHTLAQPNLVALSGESANFLVGGEFPVPVGVDQFGRLQIEFKPFGVSLAFVPTVIADGLINLSVAPEVSSIDSTVGLQFAGYTVPGLKVRRAKTSLELHDGEAFALAGLIQSDFADTIKAIPGLGKVPILGTLFRSSYYNRGETELVIVVTPHIVRPVKPSQILLPTSRVETPSDLDFLLMGKSEKNNPPLRPHHRWAPLGRRRQAGRSGR